jgi:hypothetical protein
MEETGVGRFPLESCCRKILDVETASHEAHRKLPQVDRAGTLLRVIPQKNFSRRCIEKWRYQAHRLRKWEIFSNLMGMEGSSLLSCSSLKRRASERGGETSSKLNRRYE